MPTILSTRSTNGRNDTKPSGPPSWIACRHKPWHSVLEQNLDFQWCQIQNLIPKWRLYRLRKSVLRFNRRLRSKRDQKDQSCRLPRPAPLIEAPGPSNCADTHSAYRRGVLTALTINTSFTMRKPPSFWIRFYLSLNDMRISIFRILPVGVLGRASTKKTFLGHLNAASSFRQWAEVGCG